MKITCTFVKERETKGAVRYQEVDVATNNPLAINEGAKIGTLYVRKDAFEGNIFPDQLTLTLDTQA